MYKLKKLGKIDLCQMLIVATILNTCGKDLADKYDLHHWDNPLIKTFIIVIISDIKNDIFLLYNNEKPVATFMTKIIGEVLHFEKLGTLPCESGKGIGSFCMVKIEELAKNAGCKKIIMEVYAQSHKAISFYEHKGYGIAGAKGTLKYKVVKMEKSIR